MAERYTPKNLDIEAIQFNGYNYEEISDFFNGHASISFIANEVCYMELNNNYFYKRLYEGDYLVKHLTTGIFDILTEDDFNKNYKKISKEKDFGIHNLTKKIGIIYKNNNWAMNVYNTIVNKIPNNLIKSQNFINTQGFCRLKCDGWIQCIPATETSCRGQIFDYVIVEKGVPESFIQTVIKPRLALDQRIQIVE